MMRPFCSSGRDSSACRLMGRSQFPHGGQSSLSFQFVKREQAAEVFHCRVQACVAGGLPKPAMFGTIRLPDRC